MPRGRQAVLAAWAAAAVMSMVAVRAWVVTAPARARPGWTVPVTTTPERHGSRSDLTAQVRGLIARDPFRVDRRPADPRFDPWQRQAAVAVSRAPARPSLTLVGLVGGPPWMALIEGIPGRETGVVLTDSDVVNGIRLLGVRGDTVRVSGLDTTWVLVPRRVRR